MCILFVYFNNDETSGISVQGDVVIFVTVDYNSWVDHQQVIQEIQSWIKTDVGLCFWLRYQDNTRRYVSQQFSSLVNEY